jgi:predicted HicB family RNase H-like nuclease
MMKYKGYIGRTEIDAEGGMIFGEVIGLRDVITFRGTTVPEAVASFRESVDLYLETCEEQGIEPDRPYSGTIYIRTRPDVHRALAQQAQARGKSLNDWVEKMLVRAARKHRLELLSKAPGKAGGPPSSGKASEAKSGGRVGESVVPNK